MKSVLSFSYNFLMAVLILVTSCSPEEEMDPSANNEILIESISIKIATIKDSKNLKLSAAILPLNASNKEVVWEVSDKSIASLSNIGILTPLTNGTVKIKCTAKDGSGTSDEKSFEFLPPVLVEAINIGEYSITDGQPLQLNASITPSNAENTTLHWSVSDNSIAEIDQTGLLIPRANGTVEIRIQATDGSEVQRVIVVEISGVPIEYATILKAENVLLWQRDNGGWSKEPHNSFDGYSRPQTPQEIEEATAKKSYTDTTIDNEHTVGEIRILLDAFKNTSNPAYLEASTKGVQYLFEAQYANGGWPQYYPLRTNYSRHITFNDNAMYNVMMLLKDIHEVKANTQYLDESFRAMAKTSFDKGLEVILASQIIRDGTPTAWCAQHHATTLEPVMARSYEHPSNSGFESLGLIRILMSIENPSTTIINAVNNAVAWFETVKIIDAATQRITDSSQPTGEDVILVDSPGNSLWARFYDIATNQPIFSGRNGVIKNSLAEIENERRTGYAWYGTWPKNLLSTEYPSWKTKNGIP
jgi:PelA/Pel-15E family pectate lyase